MIVVTERAAETLKAMLQEADTSEMRALRLQVTERGLTFSLDEPRSGDHVVHYQGVRLVLVDEELAPVLSGALIDIQEGAPEPAFRMIH